MIPNDFVQSLLARVDIVEVIDRLVPLKKAGANYVACCPFHKEKTPSFSVSPSKQFYHCFGCGAHGTAIGFLMEYSGKTFPEAVEDLAREAGLTVPQIHTEHDKPAPPPDHYAMMQTAARFYRAQLRETPSAIAYLKQRGLTGEIAARYGIGYAPNAWQSLEQVFPDYRNTALDALRLVVQNEDRRYDFFRHRIMFPIHDARGRTIAFGGRVISDDDKPKYLNSPETALFSKGHELYGLYQARDAIRRQSCVIVVEGYMDAVALAQHGIDYCVATLGTATTAAHMQKLYRLTDNVVFCFDGDNAGRKAAWRALENALPVLQDGKRASFLFLPDGLDPDDFVRQRGRAAFEEALNRATPLSEFLLAEMTAQNPPHNAEGRAALIHALQPLLASVTAPALSALLRRRLAELTQLPESELRVLLSSRSTIRSGSTTRSGALNRAPSGIPSERVVPFRAARRAPSLLRELLQAVVQQPELARQHTIPVADERSPEALALNDVVRYCREAQISPQTPLSVAGLIQTFADSPHHALIAEMLASAEAQAMPPELVASQFEAALARWQQQIQQRETAALLQTPLAQLSGEQRERLAQMRREKHPPPPSPPPSSPSADVKKPERSAAERAHRHALSPSSREAEPSLFAVDDETPPF
ncbi:MAG: DNA primase [Burkholderiales bacterium]|jgi:DNA primase|nr:DNA primase [Burkholderiales bacterium]